MGKNEKYLSKCTKIKYCFEELFYMHNIMLMNRMYVDLWFVICSINFLLTFIKTKHILNNKMAFKCCYFFIFLSRAKTWTRQIFLLSFLGKYSDLGWTCPNDNEELVYSHWTLGKIGAFRISVTQYFLLHLRKLQPCNGKYLDRGHGWKL